MSDHFRDTLGTRLVGGHGKLTEAAATSQWAVCRARRPEAATRLYCFPHSGGAPGEYVRWADDLSGVEVWGIQPPGRGSRFDEPAFTEMTPLVEAIVDQVPFRAPFAFFGHSLGALVAYEVTCALRSRGYPQPERLLLSACAPPHISPTRPPLRELPDADLVDAIDERFGGLPAAVRDEPELLGLLLPAFRADFTVFEMYQHQHHAPLTQPMLVFGGDQDRLAPEQLAQWGTYTTGTFDLRMLPGRHFYLRDEPARGTLLRMIADVL
jgi:surfactin synthase thioesterase subunit